MGIFKHFFLTEGNIPPSHGKRGSDAADLTSTPFFYLFCFFLFSSLQFSGLQSTPGGGKPAPDACRAEMGSVQPGGRGQEGGGMGRTSPSDGRLLEAGHF